MPGSDNFDLESLNMSMERSKIMSQQKAVEAGVSEWQNSKDIRVDEGYSQGLFNHNSDLHATDSHMAYESGGNDLQKAFLNRVNRFNRIGTEGATVRV